MKRLLDNIWTPVAFGLIVIGIIGLCWDIFKTDGWLEKLLGIVFSQEAQQSMLVTPILIGIGLLMAYYLQGGFTSSGRVHPLSSGIVYIFMAFGAYYSYLWITA